VASDLFCADEAVEPAPPFAGLESAFDSVSRRHLARTGLDRGWDCWEVGAGSGSVARWLADQVGPSGSVLATDIDVGGMPAVHPDLRVRPNLRVLEHDLAGDPVPEGAFRCVHARLVLGDLPERQDILARLASALAPGGWIVIEDLDLSVPRCPDTATPDQRLVHKVRSGFAELLSGLRGDSGWAAALPSRLRDLGLGGVRATTYLAGVRGGSVASSVERANITQVRDNLVAFGAATEEEVDGCLQLLGDPGFRFTMPLMVSTRGRHRSGGRPGR